MDTEEPKIMENIGRNELGRFINGHGVIAGAGRPRNGLKDYVRRKLNLLTDGEKEVWMKENGISGELQWRMAEGQPQQDSDVTSGGLPIPIIATQIIKE